MAKNRVFISYKREEGEPWPAMAEKFRIKFANYAFKLDVEVFLDLKSIMPGDPWRKSVGEALAGCTHFLCLLCDSYWQSTPCRDELNAVLARRAADPASVRLLFMVAEPLKPEYLAFKEDGTAIGDVTTVGEFHLVGPFDDFGRLVPLVQIDKWSWSDAVEEMITSIAKTMH